jgi:hypothetical protein
MDVSFTSQLHYIDVVVDAHSLLGCSPPTCASLLAVALPREQPTVVLCVQEQSHIISWDASVAHWAKQSGVQPSLESRTAYAHPTQDCQLLLSQQSHTATPQLCYETQTSCSRATPQSTRMSAHQQHACKCQSNWGQQQQLLLPCSFRHTGSTSSG